MRTVRAENTMTKHNFCDGRRRLFIGQGPDRLQLGEAPSFAGPARGHAEARSLHQRRSRHDEPVSARRSFVTEDGAETDLDIGHYERFLDVNLSGAANATTGQVYSTVIAKDVVVSIWAIPFRLFRTSRMRSRM